VKKILLFLASVLIIISAFACSKDNVAPSFSAFEKAQKPTNFLASFFKNTVAKDDSIRLTWDMPDTSSITNFIFAWSDSNVFDLGNKGDEYTNNGLKTTYTLQTKKVLQRMGYVSNPDSFIVYFTVSAVYNNKELTDFIGPRAVIDSALVYRK